MSISDEKTTVEDDIDYVIQRELAEYAENVREKKATLSRFTNVTKRDTAGHPSRVVAEFELFHGGEFEQELPVSRVDRTSADTISIEELLEEEGLHTLEEIEWALPFEVSVTPQTEEWVLPENHTSRSPESSTTTQSPTRTQSGYQTSSRPNLIDTGLRLFLPVFVFLFMENIVLARLISSVTSPGNTGDIQAIMTFVDIVGQFIYLSGVLGVVLIVIGVASKHLSI